jgi:hypothetical protein
MKPVKMEASEEDLDPLWKELDWYVTSTLVSKLLQIMFPRGVKSCLPRISIRHVAYVAPSSSAFG